jgi:hypothetical protein
LRSFWIMTGDFRVCVLARGRVWPGRVWVSGPFWFGRKGRALYTKSGEMREIQGVNETGPTGSRSGHFLPLKGGMGQGLGPAQAARTARAPRIWPAPNRAWIIDHNQKRRHGPPRSGTHREVVHKVSKLPHPAPAVLVILGLANG